MRSTATSTATATPVEALVSEFCDYLANERGLVAETVHHHRRFACLFLAELGIAGKADLAGLTVAAVTSFAVSQAQPRRYAVAGQRATLAVALRVSDGTRGAAAGSSGAVGAGMAIQLAAPRGQRRPGRGHAGLCDRDSAVRRRDYAILTLPGLRRRLAGRATAILDGKAAQVAAGIRRRATTYG
jgi:hypothetical protein